MQRLWRWVAGLTGLAALLLALGIGAFRLAIEMLPGYQDRVVERVREATGLSLEFDSVYGRIGRHGPEIVFRGARVLPGSGDEPLVTAAAGRVSLSIPRSIWYRRLEVARVAFVRPHLRFVITADGRIRLVGQSALLRPGDDPAPMTLDRLPRGHFAVTDAVLEVLDLRGRQGRFQLTGADVELVRKGDDVTLTGRVELPEHLGRLIDVEAEAGGDLADSALGRLADPGRSGRPRHRSVGGDAAGQLSRAGGRARLDPGFRARHGACGHEREAAAATRGPAPCRSDRVILARRRRHPRAARRQHDLDRGHRSRVVAARRAVADGELSRRGSRARTGTSPRPPCAPIRFASRISRRWRRRCRPALCAIGSRRLPRAGNCATST